jgi:hypothetical protein
MRLRSIMNSEQGIYLVCVSVPDTDPQVFGRPGSPLVRGTDPDSGSVYHLAKIVRKTSISTVLLQKVSISKETKKNLLAF